MIPPVVTIADGCEVSEIEGSDERPGDELEALKVQRRKLVKKIAKLTAALRRVDLAIAAKGGRR